MVKAKTLAREVLILAGLLILQGCVSTGSMGVIAKSGVNPIENLKRGYKEVGPAKAKSCRSLILGVIPAGNADVSAVAEAAMRENGSDALINVTTSNSLYGFIPIYNVVSFACTTVSGIGIQWLDPQSSVQETPPVAQ